MRSERVSRKTGAARAAASDGDSAASDDGATSAGDVANGTATSVGAGAGGTGATEAAAACGDATPQQRLGSAGFSPPWPQSCVQHDSAFSSATAWPAAPQDADVPTTSRSAMLQLSSERFVTSGRLYVGHLTCNVRGPTCTSTAQKPRDPRPRRRIPSAGCPCG